MLTVFCLEVWMSLSSRMFNILDLMSSPAKSTWDSSELGTSGLSRNDLNSVVSIWSKSSDPWALSWQYQMKQKFIGFEKYEKIYNNYLLCTIAISLWSHSKIKKKIEDNNLNTNKLHMLTYPKSQHYKRKETIQIIRRIWSKSSQNFWNHFKPRGTRGNPRGGTEGNPGEPEETWGGTQRNLGGPGGT